MDTEQILKTALQSEQNIARVDTFIQELLKWNKNFNIISRKNTKSDIENMILDCMGLTKLMNNKEQIIDIGSGGGFPGVILAILGYDHCSLVERSQKKAKFLLHISSLLNLKCTVHNKDIRDILHYNADDKVIVSKAVAKCLDLINMSEHIFTHSKNTRFLLLKGDKLDQEISEAKTKWSFKLQKHKNHYRMGGMIAEISNIKKL